jgi:hypothetical protein
MRVLENGVPSSRMTIVIGHGWHMTSVSWVSERRSDP